VNRLSTTFVIGLALLALIMGASHTSAASQAASLPEQAIDPDPSAASTIASDVGTARRLADMESRHEPRGIEPGAGRWKTWAIPSASELRLPAPPDRHATAAEIQQLKALASQRDTAARQRVAFWDAGAPSYRWVEIALNQLQAKPMSNPRIQRGMALMNTAIYDALVAAWDSKYAYNRARPSEFDKSLTTLIPNPNSPS
jgi:hypothetical protein